MFFGSLTKLFKPSTQALQANQLYCHAIAQARQPFFYTQLNVADTIDGRFDMITLHVFLLSRALGHQGSEKAQALRQDMVNRMFQDMDQSLREMGVGDVGIPKKTQKMAYALNGRMQAYEESFAEEAQLAQAILRNVYRAEPSMQIAATQLASYMQQSDKCLSALSLEGLLHATLNWPELSAA